MKKYAQMALVLLLITMLSGGCTNNSEPLPGVDTNLTYEYTPSITEYSESAALYEGPPWQTGYIEDLENLHTQPPYSYEIIVPFGRYDWISIRGGIIIAQNAVDFCEIYRVITGFDYAFLNLSGEYITPLGTFNRINLIQVGDNFVVVQDNYGNPGVYDFSGNPIIPTGQYQTIGVVHNNAAVVKSHEGWGAVNLDGTIIIPFGIYSNIFSVGESGDRLFVTEEQTETGTQRRGLRDSEGNVITVSHNVRNSAYGMAVLWQSDDGYEYAFNKETGEIVSFPTQGLEPWDRLRIIKPGYAMTGHGIFNFSGERISPENLFFHTQYCREYWLFPVSQDNRVGIYNLLTNEVFWLGSEFRITEVSYPLVLVTKMDLPSHRESAVLDFYGQEVISFDTYYSINILGENRFLVRTDGGFCSGFDTKLYQSPRKNRAVLYSYAVVNAAGQEIIPAGKYGTLLQIGGTDFLWMEFSDHDGEATGVVDFNGQIVFPRNRYLVLGHWGLRTDAGFADNHFFVIEDSDRNVALVRVADRLSLS